MARIPRATREQLPEDMLEFWDRLAANGPIRDIHATQANNAPLLRASRTFSNTLWTKGGLTPAQREMVILRTAVRVNSAYEWHQHVPIGLDAGLSREKVLALTGPSDAPVYDATEQALLRYVDAVAGMGDVPQETFDGAAAHFPVPTLVGITLLSGFYTGISRYMAAMDLQPETTFVGWKLEGV